MLNAETTKQPLLASIKHSLIYLSLIPFVAAILVVWISYHRINDFRSNQIDISTSVVNSVAHETSRVVAVQNKLLNIFVENERYYIKKYVSEPDSEIFEEILTKKMKYYFPDYFTFTVVDEFGNLIAEDYDGYIGEICLRDIKDYVKTGHQHIQVHPNPFIYHVDVITKIDRNKKDGYFFASFAATNFSRLLKLSSPINQSLMLINTERKDLIEVVEDGARAILKRDSFILTADESSRILFSKPVQGTHWRLVSISDKNVFYNYNHSVVVIGIIIVFIFILSSAFMAVTLCRAEKIRISSEQAKEEMFSLFSHELRSPLNSIYGAVQLLEFNCDQYSFDEDTKVIISDAVANSEHMILLINDLLDMQKLESGKMSFHFEKVELNTVIIESISLNARFADMHHVSVLFEPQHDITLTLDKQRFSQVLTNLLSNAIKYSPENETVIVKTAVERGNAVISVIDHGPGVNEDIQDTLFEKFAQSKSSLTKRVGGTGLGLSIVKSIVEEHRGHIRFKSVPGEGSEFIVKIPLIS